MGRRWADAWDMIDEEGEHADERGLLRFTENRLLTDEQDERAHNPRAMVKSGAHEVKLLFRIDDAGNPWVAKHAVFGDGRVEPLEPFRRPTQAEVAQLQQSGQLVARAKKKGLAGIPRGGWVAIGVASVIAIGAGGYIIYRKREEADDGKKKKS